MQTNKSNVSSFASSLSLANKRSKSFIIARRSKLVDQVVTKLVALQIVKSYYYINRKLTIVYLHTNSFNSLKTINKSLKYHHLRLQHQHSNYSTIYLINSDKGINVFSDANKQHMGGKVLLQIQ